MMGNANSARLLLLLAFTLVSLNPVRASSVERITVTTSPGLAVAKPPPSLVNASGARPVPDEITRNLKSWERGAGWLHFLQIVLSLAAIVSSVLVAANLGPSRVVRVLAVCSALFTGVVSSFDPGGEANRMRNAWRLLNTALLRYQAGGTGIEQVIDAYERGEIIIGSYTVSLNTQGSQESKSGQPEPLPPEGN